MDGRFRTRLCRARRLNRSWSLPAEATGRGLPDGLTGWVAGRVAFSLFSACTISRMKNRPSVQFGDKIVHSAVFSYGKLYTLKLLCQWTMRCGPEGIARGRIPTSRTRACGPLCRARPSQARRRTPSGVVRHGRPFRARLCRRARRHGRIWAFVKLIKILFTCWVVLGCLQFPCVALLVAVREDVARKGVAHGHVNRTGVRRAGATSARLRTRECRTDALPRP